MLVEAHVAVLPVVQPDQTGLKQPLCCEVSAAMTVLAGRSRSSVDLLLRLQTSTNLIKASPKVSMLTLGSAGDLPPPVGENEDCSNVTGSPFEIR